MVYTIFGVLALMLGYIILKIKIHNDNLDDENDPDTDYRG
jgi:hypothetical protein